MRKILITLACTLLTFSGMWALDARQRNAQTIVVDALAQLPIAGNSDYNTVMNELMGTGAQGVEQLASMLVPASDGKNNIVEYALDGLVAYATGNATPAQRAEICTGLENSIDKCTDNPNKAFLMTLLQRLSRPEDAAFFVKYINDPYLSEWAQNGLILTPNCDEAVIALKNDSKLPKAVYARLIGAKKIASEEATLLAMLPGADDATATAVYKALAYMGGMNSLATLAKVAQKENYAWLPTDATAAYLKLLNTLAANDADKKAVAKEAKAILKKTNKTNVRSAALEALFTAEGNAALPYLVAAMGDNNREYRVGALRYSEPWIDAKGYAALSKILVANNNKQVKADILNWYGTNKVDSQIDAIVANVGSSDNEIAESAMRALSKIGGEKALATLMDQLNSSRADVAYKALLSFNGKINDAVVAALAGNGGVPQVINALSLASARQIKAAAPSVFKLLNSSNAEVASAANAALVGVVSPDNYSYLCELLEKAPADKQAQIQTALKAAVAKLSAEEQYNLVKPYVAKSSKPALYYPLLAQAGNANAVAELTKGYANAATKQAALDAMLQVNNPEMIDVLYNVAVSDAAANGAALNRYAQLVAKSGYNPIRKYQLYRRALEASKDAAASNNIINGLASTGTYQALMLANNYIADAATADASAAAIRAIMNKNIDVYGGAPVRKALENAAARFRADKNNADAGYAVDDINGMLGKVVDSEYKPLAGDCLKYKAVAGAPDAKIAAKAQKAADAVAQKAWEKTGNGIKYLGGEASTIALEPKDLENFEMWIEWLGEEVPVIGVRSLPISVEGALTKALNPAGEWNTAYIKVDNDRVTVIENGVVTAENATMVNSYDAAKPAYAKGQILLGGNGKPVEFREIIVKELPSTPRSELTAEEKAEGFEMLFDGTSMHKWTGNTAGYIPSNGYIYVDSQWGGNLYTVNEYSDFIYRFEFCFDTPGVNNGVGIRTPMGVDAAFHGMEIQILDHDDPIYKGLNDYQVHGSVYGVIPAKRAKFEHGVWNTEEIRAVGDQITVTVNGEVILDGNIREACQGHAVGDPGEQGNHWMVDHRNHPGLFNKSGHIGFLGHGKGIRFRNVRVKDLSKKKK